MCCHCCGEQWTVEAEYVFSHLPHLTLHPSLAAALNIPDFPDEAECPACHRKFALVVKFLLSNPPRAVGFLGVEVVTPPSYNPATAAFL